MDINKFTKNLEEYGFKSFEISELTDLKVFLNKNIKNIQRKNKRLEGQINNKKKQLKLNQALKKNNLDLYQKLFKNKKVNFSIMYKNINGKKYIKARFTWEKKQREVQIGSIKSLMAKLKELNIITPEIAHSNIEINNWDIIKKNKKISMHVRSYSYMKILSYMISASLKKNTINPVQKENSYYSPEYKQTKNIHKAQIKEKNEVNISKINNDWYKSWKTQKD